MGYTLALSFSNIQFGYGQPLIIVGIAFKTNQLPNLSSLHTKENLFPNNPYDLPKFNLSILESELKIHEESVLESQVVEIKKPRGYQGDTEEILKLFLDGYLKTINKIISSNILIASEGIDICFLHEPITRDGEEIPLQATLFSSHKLYSKYKLISQNKKNFCRIMHLARLFATNEYLKKRRNVTCFLREYTEVHENKLRQVARVLWKSPNIQNFADSFVGYPELLFRTNLHAEKIPLIVGKSLNIYPIGYSCFGIANERNDFRSKISSCCQTSKALPFGKILSNKKRFELCRYCSKKTDIIYCLSTKPKCDGSQIPCGNDFFAGNICNGNFSIYISIFGNAIKVGRSILSRTVGRLLEQAAFDGLVFYPVNSLQRAHYLENELAKVLNSKIQNLKAFGFEKVKTSITAKERFEHIKSLLKQGDSKGRKRIYDEVKQLLDDINIPHIKALLSSEHLYVNFSRNWITEKSLEAEKVNLVTDVLFEEIKGKIEGVIGPFLFLNEKAYSLKNLQGCIIECQ